jgi:hypothetical protein
MEAIVVALLACLGFAQAVGAPAWLKIVAARVGMVSGAAAVGLHLAERRVRTWDAAASTAHGGPRRRSKVAAIVLASLVFVAAAVAISLDGSGSRSEEDGRSTVRGQTGLTASLGVLNVTRGDRKYGETVRAYVDDVVQVQVSYVNRSERSLGDLTARIVLPTTARRPLPVRGEISAGGETLHPTANILSLDRARLSYIEKSLVWRHERSDGGAPAYRDEPLSDGALVGAPPMLGTIRPGESRTVALQVRVAAPVLSIVVQCRSRGQWTALVPARRGERRMCRVVIRNEGNLPIRDVRVTNAIPTGTRMAGRTSGSEELWHPTDQAPVRGTAGSHLFETSLGGLRVGESSTLPFALVVNPSASGDAQHRAVAAVEAAGVDAVFNVVVLDIAAT